MSSLQSHFLPFLKKKIKIFSSQWNFPAFNLNKNIEKENFVRIFVWFEGFHPKVSQNLRETVRQNPKKNS